MAKKTETKAAPKPAANAEAPKYGIDYLSEATGLAPATIRQGLRSLDIEKPGPRWGWDKKADADAIVKQLKERSERAPDMTKGKAKEPAKAKEAPKSTKSAAKGSTKKKGAEAA